MRYMKKILISILGLVGTLGLWAQNPLLDDMPYVTLVQDSTIDQLLDTKINGRVGEEILIDGFRVQIFSSNVQQQGKAEALALEKALAPKIDQPVYVSYISPSWKVRIGDFRTFEEAQEYKNELVKRFPKLQASSYVIGDQIRVIQ